jgi:putative holliday junction resolvase
LRGLGVDFGGSRIGLAVMEKAHGLGRTLPPLASQGALAKDALQIKRAARREEAEVVALGLPLSQGEETRMSRICRKLAAELEALGLKVALVDEALTSYEAESEMKEAGLKGSQIRKKVDGEAALRILERWRVIEEGS